MENNGCHERHATTRYFATFSEEPRKWRQEWVRCQLRYGHLGPHKFLGTEDGKVYKYEWYH